jgi:hypothetical protein
VVRARRRVLAIGLALLGAAAACSTYGGAGDTIGPDGGGGEGGDAYQAVDADAEDGALADVRVEGGVRFYCPGPAGSCAFLDEVCCFGEADGGAVGVCRDAGALCAPDYRYYALCDSPGPCRTLYGGSASATCCAETGHFACAPSGCGSEVCPPTIQPAECIEAGAVCRPDPYGYGYCN